MHGIGAWLTFVGEKQSRLCEREHDVTMFVSFLFEVRIAVE